MSTKRRVRPVVVLVAALPYIALGYPWFSVFQRPWFEGGGLTVQQLQEGPSFAVAYTVATLSTLVMAYVLALAIASADTPSALRGVKVAFVLWLGFIAAVLGTQYVFEGRALVYFGVTAGYPLAGLLIMGAILGAWGHRPTDAR